MNWAARRRRARAHDKVPVVIAGDGMTAADGIIAADGIDRGRRHDRGPTA